MTPLQARPIVEALLQRIEALPGEWPMTGGTLAVVSPHEVLAVSAFGRQIRGGQINVDNLFEIGSISKVFNAFMILKLVDDGLCDLDAPVTDYLPWFSVISDFPPFTLRHLLHHTSGLVKGADDPPDELCQCWALRDTQTGSAPGTFFHYSNAGYLLLGLVIKSVTGMAAPDFCRQHLLAPLGMDSTVPRIINADRPRFAVGTCPERDDQPWLPGDGLAPATWFETETTDGNVASTASDMGMFMRMLLGDGTVDGSTVFPPSLLRRMTGDLAVGGEPFTSGFGAKRVTDSRYGLGINVEQVEGHTCLTHGGGMVGYSSFLMVDVTAGIGICVLTNANGCYPVGQVIARLGHAMLTSPDLNTPALGLDLRPDDVLFDPDMLGTFVTTSSTTTETRLSVAQHRGRLVFSSNGKHAQIYRDWGSRLGTNHPDFRRFHLRFLKNSTQCQWIYGDMTFRRDDAANKSCEPHIHSYATQHLGIHVGRYRSYTPWFPTFRIVLRSGRLYLIAPGGVEASDEEEELVEVGPGEFRIGADERLPERLIMGPVVDGRTMSAFRDGCRYSRVSTD